MNQHTKPMIAAMLLAAFIAAACAGDPARESTGEYIDDATITTKVKAAFVKDPKVDALDVKVETFKGSVQLSGFADSSEVIDRAVELARTTPGVKAVKNDIRLKAR